MYEVTAAQFKARRDQVIDAIGPNSVAVLFSTPERSRSNDTNYPYRPDSDLMYLTGFREPDCIAVLAPGHADGDFIMFVRERDPEKEVWDGLRAGTDGAMQLFGADKAHPISQVEEILGDYLEHRDTLHFAWGEYPEEETRMMRIIEKLRSTRKQAPKAPKRLADIRDIVHEMRLFKRPEEIQLMRRAAQITSDAHIRAMKLVKPGVHEYELQAEIEHHFKLHGGEFPAYSSIVGAAANATILHYTENRDEVQDGDVVLIDAGCEYHFYAADITRTFPANGKFTPAQRDAYQAVLDSQKQSIEEAKAGLRYDELQRLTVQRLTQSLIDMSVLKGSVDENVETEAYKRFYPHNVGHFLGIDVHDVGRYFDDEGEWRKLEPGMVLTIEPGLYFPHEDDVPAELRGVGIRIEDDILVTNDGNENLTAMCPKEVSEIEDIVGTP